jgi:hypothetical protein
VDGRRYIGAIGILAVTSACVGTADSLHFVRGEAPAVGGCEVTVTEAGRPDRLTREAVQGPFAVSYTLGGPFPRKVDVVAYCNGVKVKELKSISPRGTGDAELGKIAP